MEELNIHEHHEWHGIFTLPNNQKNIHGKIIYSPDDGIILEYLCDFSTGLKKEDHIHGKLHNAKVCTLIGNLDLNESGLSFGMTAVRHGTIKFDFLIYGEFSTPNEKFLGFDANFTSLQEFCCPQGLKDNLDYSYEPLSKFENESLEISIQHSAKTNFPPEKISTLFVSNNKNTLEDLDTETQSIYQKYRDNLFVKKDTSFFIRTKEFPEKGVFELHKTLFKLELFFATLIHHPVRANTFKLLKTYEHDSSKHKAINILFSPFDLDKKR